MTRDHQKKSQGSSERMPVLFVGHGSPMNLIEDNEWSRGFSALGQLVPKPSAILSISAHWYQNGTFITGNAEPKTIYDFSGFPQALYEIEYRTPGNVDLAERVRALLGDEKASLDSRWGIDHGTWSVLRWMYPDGSVPVIQLSLDRRLSVADHQRLARSLAPLRYENVLILGSGNVTHNLREAFRAMQTGSRVTPGWAARFDQEVAQIVAAHDSNALLSVADTDDGRLAHPTPDHWLPLIYAQAASDQKDTVSFPTEGFDLGSLSMRNILFS